MIGIHVARIARLRELIAIDAWLSDHGMADAAWSICAACGAEIHDHRYGVCPTCHKYAVVSLERAIELINNGSEHGTHHRRVPRSYLVRHRHW